MLHISLAEPDETEEFTPQTTDIRQVMLNYKKYINELYPETKQLTYPEPTVATIITGATNERSTTIPIESMQ